MLTWRVRAGGPHQVFTLIFAATGSAAASSPGSTLTRPAHLVRQHPGRRVRLRDHRSVRAAPAFV